MTMTMVDAIKSLKPNADWVVTGDYTYENLEWLDESQTKPTKTELETEVTRLQTEYDNNAYQRSRLMEYPDWGTQLDYIYHNGIDKWKTDIVDPVKAKYPKPS
tara:strand:+ start:557 stop:865 length:309 start_codon:yes stop_codon:yes gene_type:complete